MRSLPIPDHCYEQVYRACVEGKREPVRTDLLNKIPTLLINEQNYRIAAENGNLWQLQILSEEFINQNTKSELNKLYDERFVKNPSPGRHIYDALTIIGRPRCTLCNHSYPNTLDHFLPKDIQAYPELSIVPINLISCCSNCNQLKHNHVPRTPNEQFFHPYFDNLDRVPWLSASVNYSENSEISLVYKVVRNKQNADNFERIRFQFDRLNLAELYGAQAATVLEDIELNVRNIYNHGGSAQVSEYIFEEYNSRNAANPNSWQTAFYSALYQNQRFCTLNWRL